MTKYFLMLLFFSPLFFAQEKGNPNVELPDFVITGKESFTLPRVEKEIPPLISTVSDTYLKPVFPAEALEIQEFSDPLKNNPALAESNSSKPGMIKLMMGSLYLPSVEIFLKENFVGIDLTSHTDAKNRRAFTENADGFLFKQKFVLGKTFSQAEDLIPGTTIFLEADFDFNQYKMFATNPLLKRSWNKIDLALGLKNLSSKSFAYSLSFAPTFFNLSGDAYDLLPVNPINVFSESYKSTGLQSLGMMNIAIGKMKLTLSGNFSTYKNEYQSVESKSEPFILGSGNFEIPLSKIFYLGFGVNYAKYDTNSSVGAKGKISLQLDKGITLALGVNSSAKLFSPQDFFKLNNYLFTPTIPFLLHEEKNKIFVDVRYEFDKYFEIQAGGEIFKSENTPYFVSTGDGRFTVTIDTVSHSSAYLKLYFHQGPLGSFYFDSRYNSLKNNSGSRIPYSSPLEAALTYSKQLDKEWGGRIFINYESDFYYDIVNLVKGESILDLSFEVEYRSSENLAYNLRANNLLNQKKFEFEKYTQPGLNISLGLNYTW